MLQRGVGATGAKAKNTPSRVFHPDETHVRIERGGDFDQVFDAVDGQDGPGNGGSQNCDTSESSGGNTASEHNQEDTINGVKWYDKDSENRSSGFAKLFTRAIRYTDLGGRAKFLVCSRYVQLYEIYEQKAKRSRQLAVRGSVFVTLGTLLLPVILTIGDKIAFNSVECDDDFRGVYVTTVILSFSVSLVNALMDLFQVRKRFYLHADSHDLLEFEGWSFIYLEGHYTAYESHRDCWQEFLFRAERVNYSAKTKNVMLYQTPSEAKHPGDRAILKPAAAMHVSDTASEPNNSQTNPIVTELERAIDGISRDQSASMPIITVHTDTSK